MHQLADKNLLVKTYQEQERQIKVVRELVMKKKDEYTQMQKKMDLAKQVMKKAEEEEANQERREQRAQQLERLTLKAETLAARENSSQNSTPEAREINNEIEEQFEEVYKLEATITQLKLDVTAFKQDIDLITKEREDKTEIAMNKMASMYRNIQQLREEASQIRFSNLQTLIQNQNDEVGAEIEINRMQTLVMLYNELNNSMNVEFNSAQTPETSSMMIDAELSKFKQLSTQIPTHNPESVEEQNKLIEGNRELTNQIAELEQKIMSSITAMAKEEDKQDELANTLKQSQQNSKKLLETLRNKDNTIADLQQTIQEMKEKDATKKDKALEELDRLKFEIIQLVEENNKKWEAIKQLRSGQSSLKPKTTNSPVDLLCQKIHQSTEELERQTNELIQEEESLTKQLISEELH